MKAVKLPKTAKNNLTIDCLNMKHQWDSCFVLHIDRRHCTQLAKAQLSGAGIASNCSQGAMGLVISSSNQVVCMQGSFCMTA